MRFFGEETYPGIGVDFERSFERLRSLPAEIFLASHAEVYRLEEKRAARADSTTSPFVDPEGYGAYLDAAEARYREVIAEQRSDDRR
jgi:metallo-beta-lactamase class B